MIYFREAIEPRPSANDSGRLTLWHLEYYEDFAEDGTPHRRRGFPVGIAFVIEVDGSGAQLNFVFVADQWRGRGYGKELLLAAQARWPGLTWTGAMDEAGAGLLKAAGFVVDDDA